MYNSPLNLVDFSHTSSSINLSYFLRIYLQVKVTQKIQGFQDPREIRKLKRGDYFGEKALLRWVETQILYMTTFSY